MVILLLYLILIIELLLSNLSLICIMYILHSILLMCNYTVSDYH